MDKGPEAKLLTWLWLDTGEPMIGGRGLPSRSKNPTRLCSLLVPQSFSSADLDFMMGLGFIPIEVPARDDDIGCSGFLEGLQDVATHSPLSLKLSNIFLMAADFFLLGLPRMVEDVESGSGEVEVADGLIVGTEKDLSLPRIANIVFSFSFPFLLSRSIRGGVELSSRPGRCSLEELKLFLRFNRALSSFVPFLKETGELSNGFELKEGEGWWDKEEVEGYLWMVKILVSDWGRPSVCFRSGRVFDFFDWCKKCDFGRSGEDEFVVIK
jgi:hypothetical protein